MAAVEEIIKEILSRSILLRVGQRSIIIIKKRVADGIFEDGSTESNQYSQKPFAMPLGAVKKKSVLLEILKGKHLDDTMLIKSKKSGKLWVVIKHGYEWLRKVSGKQSSKVDFTWTRELMRSLTEIKVNVAEASVEVKHKGKRNEELARWWNVEGAGKGKKLRKWLYLTEEELNSIAEKL